MTELQVSYKNMKGSSAFKDLLEHLKVQIENPLESVRMTGEDAKAEVEALHLIMVQRTHRLEVLDMINARLANLA